MFFDLEMEWLEESKVIIQDIKFGEYRIWKDNVSVQIT